MTDKQKNSLREILDERQEIACDAPTSHDGNQADRAAMLPLMSADEEKLNELGRRARLANKKGVELLLEIKEILAEAHGLLAQVGRGSQFGAWVEEHFPDLSERTVQRYLKVHQAFKNENAAALAQFDVTALYLLSEDKVTDTTRSMALLIAKDGGRITTEAARHFAANPWDANSKKSADPRPESKSKPTVRKRIETDSGEVVVNLRSSNGNIMNALKEAIAKIQGVAD
jgi:hypothetical protein